MGYGSGERANGYGNQKSINPKPYLWHSRPQAPSVMGLLQ